MARALVLNATYEPISVVSGRRAAVLVLAAKAELVQETDQRLHAERISIAVPSVIRLRRMVRVPFDRRVPLSRRAVFARDANTCQYCGTRAETIDHVVPRSRGGAHVWDNVVAACRACNVVKADRLPDEVAMTLARRPRAARRYTWVITSVPDVPSAWEPYLQAA